MPVRNVGMEGDLTSVPVLYPQAIQDATPVVSAAVDLREYPRSRVLIVASVNEVTATAHTVGFTVTESATEGGSYTAANVSGGNLLTGLTSDVVRSASLLPNNAKPWVKVTATGSHADVDVIVAIHFLFLSQAV